MQKLFNAVLLLLLAATFLSAQGGQVGAIAILQVASSPTACVWPAGATFSNAMLLCPVSTGTGTATLYYAVNGSTTFLPLVPQSVPGVASFNGRTGNVTLIPGDITGTGLKASTTATTTATTTLQ